jgi:Family of unknown function (DUF5994)
MSVVHSTPRLVLAPTASSRFMLDGGWWPRSTDPVAELPSLVMAIDAIRGPVTQLALGAVGWDTHPRRLRIADRMLRLGFFSSQASTLLIAQCANGDRVDLLVVAPTANSEDAEAAMAIAATSGNLMRAQDITASIAKASSVSDQLSDDIWAADGGSIAIAGRHAPQRTRATEATTGGAHRYPDGSGIIMTAPRMPGLQAPAVISERPQRPMREVPRVDRAAVIRTSPGLTSIASADAPRQRVLLDDPPPIDWAAEELIVGF